MLGLACAYFFRQRRVAAVAVCAILAVHLHVRPLLFFLGADTPFPDAFFPRDAWDLMAQTSLVTALWTALFLAGYTMLATPARLVSLAMPQIAATPDRSLVTFAAISATGLAAIATGMLVLQYGSVAQFTFATKIGKDLTGAYALRQLSIIAAMISAFGLFTFAKPAEKAGRAHRMIEPKYLLLFTALICVNLNVNYAWGNRYNIALLILAVGLGWHYYIRRFRLIEIVVLLLASACFLQGLKTVRVMLVSEALRQDVAANMEFWRAVSTSLHFTQFDAFMLVLRDAGDRFSFRWGEDFWNGLLAWIPRGLLPEKETFHIGAWFRRIYEPSKINGWPVSVVGSWYVNFGWIGVGAGALLSGLVTRAFDLAYSAPHNSAWHAFAGPCFGFFMLSGGVDTGFVQAIFLVFVPVFLFGLVIGARRNESRGRIAPTGRRPSA
ncbi:MAG: O-antigen polymerase [Oceanicaulis sp.]